jgi:lipid-A-disaccharide synthase
MGREVVKELIQSDFNRQNLKKELSKILDEENRKKIFSDYYELEQKLGGKGASEKTAQLIYKKIS